MSPSRLQGDRDVRSKATRVTAAILGLAGVGLLTGGFLHPAVGHDVRAEMDETAADPRWSPVHWVVTFAQAFGSVGVVLAAADLAARVRLGPWLVAGLAAVGLGLALGMLGTLVAASGVKVAAETGDLALYTTIARTDLAIGWACLLVTSAGGVLLAKGVASHPIGSKGFATVLGSGAGAMLIAALLIPYDHAWMHHYLLRGGAMAVGATLSGLATAWPSLMRRLERARG